MITRNQTESHSTLFQEVSSVRDSRLFLAYPSHPTTLCMGENNSGAPLSSMWARKKFTHREGKNATLVSFGVPSRQVLSTTDAKAIFKNVPPIHQVFFVFVPFFSKQILTKQNIASLQISYQVLASYRFPF